MARSRWHDQAIRAGRRALASTVARSGVLRSAAERTQFELSRALDPHGSDPRESPSTDGMYDASYFSANRGELEELGLSGYERYARETSNADIAAYLIWRTFAVERTLDVGCALGFVVEALRELDVDAHGCDVSRWAIDHASPAARPFVHRADLRDGLPYGDQSFELVSALETLEHLPPVDVPAAVTELARVSSAWVVCTIPSLGRNDHGPDGFPNAKVVDDRLAHYLDLGPGYDGPVPEEDLARDAAGQPIQGHLTIASYRWWTDQFALAGLRRHGDLERAIHPLLARFDLTEYWNLYVFSHPGTAASTNDSARSDVELEDVEIRWGLRHRQPSERALDLLREGLGENAVAAAQRWP